MNRDQQPFDVFISHSSKDSLTASAIKQSLQNKGIRCWKAPDDILPGESWPSAIMRALSRCRAMVLVWTSNSMTSMEVSKELTLAMRNNLMVVPFRIDNIEPVGDWEYHLANTHWMDASDGLAEKHYEVLGDFLLKVLPARESLTAPVESQMSLRDLELLIEQALEDGVLTEQERTLLMKDAVTLGRDRDEFNADLDSRLAMRKRELAAQIPDIHPAVVPSVTPPSLPVPVVSPSAHLTPKEPENHPAFSPSMPATSSTNRSTKKLILFGALWSGAFYFVGSILMMILILASGGKSAEETSDAVKVLFAIMGVITLLSPILAIWMTIKGKLPGTRKT